MKEIFKYFDKFTFFILLMICIVGVFLVYSGSHSLGKGYHSKQIVWLIFSILIFWLMIFKVKTDAIFRWGMGIYLVLVFILFIQIVAGRIISGTKSWVSFGFLSVQFSEFIKIPLALLLARVLSKILVIEWKTFFKLIGMVAGPFLLIAMQPDLGTAFILTSLILFCILIKKIRPIIVVFSLLFVIGTSAMTWSYVLKPYQRDRIVSFFNPAKYKQSTGYQIIQSKIAIGSGGLSGKGYLKGSQSEYRFLPTQHTDFIFSVLGEEFGFLGVTFLLVLFFILFYRQFNFLSQSKKDFYFILIFNGIIFFQFLVNILMSLGLFPVMGVPLPFVSYGGSSLLSFFLGEALIFKMKMNNYLK